MFGIQCATNAMRNGLCRAIRMYALRPVREGVRQRLAFCAAGKPLLTDQYVYSYDFGAFCVRPFFFRSAK